MIGKQETTGTGIDEQRDNRKAHKGNSQEV